MSPRIKHIPTSNAIIGRHPFVAPVERAAQNGTPWHIVENGYVIRIDDALTEKDVDLIEWLVRHGQPSRLRDARVAFSFSLYAAARALGCGRGRLIERIRRRMKTLIYVRVGDWECSAQVFGPTLRHIKAGVCIVTWTAEFVSLLEHGLLSYYADLVDEIIPISSPVVRRLVRRCLTHDKWGPEGIAHFLGEIRYASDATNDSQRIMRERATRDILDASDYIAAVFGVEIVTLRSGLPGISYERDKRDRRIWIQRQHDAQNSREPQPELSGTVSELSGTAARTLRNREQVCSLGSIKSPKGLRLGRSEAPDRRHKVTQ